MEKTHKNVDNWRKGKEPLKNAIMQHPEGNDVYDYLQKKVERNFWVTPFSSWEKRQKLRKS
jgi:hypothetical protein